ncbi:MAG TPA: dolichyl-phosphate beta-glucosyltransferase, partial [Chloroflexota bacterium]|nr:dolichyl-phosphate beta-glucosyltransferase [Chloroflexota bacterium]
MSRRLSLILPAYNEQARLPYTLSQIEDYLCREHIDCEVIVVDNGSQDATSAVTQQAAATFRGLRLLRTDRRGKGLAVRTGALAARGEVIIFGDADLSWSVEDLGRFVALVDAHHQVVIGSREGRGARRIGEPIYRHLMGRVFNKVVQSLAVPGVEDSQCGFKAFSAEAAQAIFSRQRIDGFGFDVEVLFLARRIGFGLRVVPLRWEHKSNSRVAPVRDTL